MRSESEYLPRRRSRQSTPSGAESVDAPADAAALLLALPRHAGNQAVNRWLEGRPLQRSCLAPREDLSDLGDPQDCTDIYTAQSREDGVYDELDVHAAALEAETARAVSGRPRRAPRRRARCARRGPCPRL